MVYEYAATTYQRLSKLDAAALQARFEELEGQAARQLEEDDIPIDRVIVQRIVDARYLGQGYELRVDVASGAIDETWVESSRATSTASTSASTRSGSRSRTSRSQHPRRGIGVMPSCRPPRSSRGRRAGRRGTPPRGRGMVPRRRCARAGHDPLYDREALTAGNRLSGPAIVNQYDTTTVIPPGVDGTVDRYGNIVIDCTTRRGTGTSRGAGLSTPIPMRVLGGAFHAIAKEMAGVLFRMSYSSIIRESEDLGAGIFDAKGRELSSRTRLPCTSARCPGTSAVSCGTSRARSRTGT